MAEEDGDIPVNFFSGGEEVVQVQSNQGGWGHVAERVDNNGARRWGVRIGNLTLSIGTTHLIPYGETARVVNVGSEDHAILDFYIPMGRPGKDFVPEGHTFETKWMAAEKGVITFFNRQVFGLVGTGAETDYGSVSLKVEQDGSVLKLSIKLAEEIKQLEQVLSKQIQKAVDDLRAQVIGDNDLLQQFSRLKMDLNGLMDDIGKLTKRVYAVEKAQQQS